MIIADSAVLGSAFPTMRLARSMRYQQFSGWLRPAYAKNAVGPLLVSITCMYAWEFPTRHGDTTFVSAHSTTTLGRECVEIVDFHMGEILFSYCSPSERENGAFHNLKVVLMVSFIFETFCSEKVIWHKKQRFWQTTCVPYRTGREVCLNSFSFSGTRGPSSIKPLREAAKRGQTLWSNQHIPRKRGGGECAGRVAHPTWEKAPVAVPLSGDSLHARNIRCSMRPSCFSDSYISLVASAGRCIKRHLHLRRTGLSKSTLPQSLWRHGKTN